MAPSQWKWDIVGHIVEGMQWPNSICICPMPITVYLSFFCPKLQSILNILSAFAIKQGGAFFSAHAVVLLCKMHSGVAKRTCCTASSRYLTCSFAFWNGVTVSSGQKTGHKSGGGRQQQPGTISFSSLYKYKMPGGLCLWWLPALQVLYNTPTPQKKKK